MTSSQEVEDVFAIEAENIDAARLSLAATVSEQSLDVISCDYSVDNREGELSIYTFTVKHYVGPTQQRKPFNPRAITD